jgi:hypothetical protein
MEKSEADTPVVVNCAAKNSKPRTSALGQERRFSDVRAMSVVHAIASAKRTCGMKVPKANMTALIQAP